MVFISRSEINRMKNNYIPEGEHEYWGLGTLTEFDIFEANHCYEDWDIVEDEKEIL